MVILAFSQPVAAKSKASILSRDDTTAVQKREALDGRGSIDRVRCEDTTAAVGRFILSLLPRRFSF